MVLVRWNPWQEIDTLQHQLNSLFDEVLVPNNSLKKSFSRIPAAEIQETPDAINLKLEVPGMEAKDLDVQVTEESVSISGDRKSETKSEEKGVTKSEFQYGKFHRVISLPSKIQHTKVEAEYKDGILNLRLPKMVEEESKVVKVSINQAAA
ncbi:MAG TPA: heat-shock protein [Cyanobacteria bacterium UBA11149]|nr:heat-shock protein [Cyanobacteria bacterium UBA11367]HBE56230.1 heat-shock protein [Cyanobacteria bacterium UBA11366]HBK65405.1 heat-shock protein [Cyanobacteria bacterium UBA11166]HBR72492.1 heat-shock protein [Cyanobacteria bacterium UBA11159]HBS71766.1 heat-shock protein [Cyanobacteria bacterium UBA11153]HBW92217.1 heat-shock protein [Cyanobacteria bacterium UBA11149]HCA93964.1 heat-shock protein [Cyanobacteria bacterium UBA9226]